ncbi:Telomerase protein component 1 [Ascosphaera pollenicola]|nr:Telomerase protein component 1 [Ascosphaera pollenicola]
MASILRQIVAGPRARHAETGLDLAYVTDNIIATSGPASAFPKRAYRNPTDELVKWLDKQHPEQWYVWEFRAEGTGYPDEEVHNRIHHFPFPDHHPPPFAIIPQLVASMRNWLLDESITDDERKKRIAVIHCKAGKGRTGTMVVSYLMSEEGWSRVRALRQFTKTRMRSGFGKGVTIASQKRYVKYVEKWVKNFDKIYVERPVEILEVRVFGLRDGVQITIDGFVEQGKKIERVHRFKKDEVRKIQPGDESANFKKLQSGKTEQKRRSTAPPEANESNFSEVSRAKRAETAPSLARVSTDKSFVSITHTSNLSDALNSLNPFHSSPSTSTPSRSSSSSSSSSSSEDGTSSSSGPSDYDNDGDNDEDPNKPKKPKLRSKSKQKQKQLRKEKQKALRPPHIPRPIRRSQPAYILHPSQRIILPTSDVNISIERRISTAGFTMATSIAHCWFNAYFEGGRDNDEGVFGVRWDQMDGIKGTNGRGMKACEGVEISWRYVTEPKEAATISEEQYEEGKSEEEVQHEMGKEMVKRREHQTEGEDTEGATLINPGEAKLIKDLSGRDQVEEVMTVPKPGEEIRESEPANWTGEEPAQQKEERGLFIRRANSDTDRKE